MGVYFNDDRRATGAPMLASPPRFTVKCFLSPPDNAVAPMFELLARPADYNSVIRMLPGFRSSKVVLYCLQFRGTFLYFAFCGVYLSTWQLVVEGISFLKERKW